MKQRECFLIMMMQAMYACFAKAQTVSANREQMVATEHQESDVEEATQFLVQCSMPADQIQLEEIGQEHGCHVLVNRSREGGFVILADRQYSSVLDSRILAYSVSKRSWLHYKKNPTLKRFLAYYGDCLQLLKQQGRHDVQLEEMTQQFHRQSPLIRTNWGQHRLETSFGGKTFHKMKRLHTVYTYKKPFKRSAFRDSFYPVVTMKEP